MTDISYVVSSIEAAINRLKKASGDLFILSGKDESLEGYAKHLREIIGQLEETTHTLETEK